MNRSIPSQDQEWAAGLYTRRQRFDFSAQQVPDYIPSRFGGINPAVRAMLASGSDRSTEMGNIVFENTNKQKVRNK